MEAPFDLVENVFSFFKERGVLLKFILETGIEIPTEIVKALILWNLLPDGFKIRSSFGEERGIQIEERCHHIDHLEAGIINIIANLCRKTEPIKNSGYGVSQNSIPEVADVHGLVGIHTRVFNKDLLFLIWQRAAEEISLFKDLGNQILGQSWPIHFEIDISGRSEGDLLNIRRELGS
jgi:hypothetical protein